MRILALDSSGLVASVALVEEGNLLAEYTIHHKKTHSQTLLPMLDTIVTMVDANLEEIDAIAISEGPGSFTGLRIGSATAKGLGLALSKPLISIPTVDGLAYNLFGYNQLICPIMDARRSQVYTGLYTFSNGKFSVLEKQNALSIEELVEKCNQTDFSEVTFLGDGVPVHQEYLEEHIKKSIQFAPAHLLRQKAGSIGSLAIEYFKNGQTQTAQEHQPEYLRLPQAERERLEKEKGIK